MPSRHLPPGALALTLTFWLQWSCSERSSASIAPPTGPLPEQTSAAVVAFVHPKSEVLIRDLSLSGEFRPWQTVDLHAKVAGYLRQIHVDVGAFVQAGQLLAVLEVPEMASDIEQAGAEKGRAEAELGRSRAELQRAQANAHVAGLSLDRLNKAAKADPGLIAQQEIDEAAARRNAAEAQVSSAGAAIAVEERRIAAAAATEQRARTMSAYTEIRAPFAGVVTKRFADPGALIQAGTASQTQAMPLVRVSDIARLRLAVTVPESAAPLVRVGQRVEIRVTALNKSMPGTIARMNRDVAASSRTMEAEIDVANTGGALTPGMYAEIRTGVERREHSLTVPVQAVSNSGGNRSVMVVSEAGVLEDRGIKTGIETAAAYEVLSGLDAADRIVISNRSLLRPGQKVRAKPVETN